MKSFLPKSLLSEDTVITLYVKTPNVFYKTKRVYIKLNQEQAIDVTEKLKLSSSLSLDMLYNIINVAKDEWFLESDELFGSPYFNVSIMYSNGKWTKPVVSGSKSPDPIDSEFTPIRK
jgi:hypothetical protein